MALGDIGRARRLAGNPSLSNVSDEDITAGLQYGTSQVIRVTGKADWESDTTHSSYKSAVMATEYYASSMIRDRFQDQSNISTEHFERAELLTSGIAESLSAGGAGGSDVGAGTTTATGRYRSYPLNPNAQIYKSSYRGEGQIVGSAGGDYGYYYNVPPSGGSTETIVIPEEEKNMELITFSEEAKGGNAIEYATPFGANIASAIEASAASTFDYAAIVRKFRISPVDNTRSGPVIVSFRDDGADVPGTILTIPAGSSAEVTSANLSVSISAGSKIDFKLDCTSAGGGLITLVGILFLELSE